MREVTLVEGTTFCVCAGGGDVEPGGVQGLYVRDTRLVSRWRLTLDGVAAEPLTVFSTAPYQATFLGRARSLLVRRDRYVGEGMREDVTVTNTTNEATFAEVTVEVGCDFADLFEVRARAVGPRGERTEAVEADGLSYELTWRGRQRGCRVTATEPTATAANTTAANSTATVLPGLLLFRVLVPARGEWSVSLGVTAIVDGKPLEAAFRLGEPVEEAVPARRLERWQRACPRIETTDAALRRTYERSCADLAALRIHDEDGTAAVAAGSPWYMTLFGRDSLLTAYLALPLGPDLALGTLRRLAELQGTRTDPASEEEPGKILHEHRCGIDPGVYLGGSHTYYGTIDATPLFVMLAGELHRHGVDVESLRPNIDRALAWLDGKIADGGFVSYRRGSDRSLVNQGWKDSADGVNYADGRLARAPIALAEAQGYAYAAYLAGAELAADEPTRRRRERQAADLRKRFDETFWLPDRGWYAVALDRDGKVDALTSNIGHCLWTGIVPAGRAEQVADQLLSEPMFTGWGVRTLASTMGAYNPVSYHNGSVWPHDNALVVAGLTRYGFAEHARQVAGGILDVAAAFDGRLPELFCGFERTDYPVPVPYPTSCSPQAWAAATPVLLLRAQLTGALEPPRPD